MGSSDRLRTGVPGLDEILGGGLPADAAYLVKGQPGTGKTTLGLHFLVEGARLGEKGLYVCWAETPGQLAAVARAYGWNVDGLAIHDMRRRRGSDAEGKGYTVFSPSEVELEETTRELLDQLEEVRPSRLVVDSLSEIRLLSEGASRYRRELLSLIDHITGGGCTALLIDVDIHGSDATIPETLASGIIHLEHLSPNYGGERRRLRISKLRASKSVGGYHDFAIRDGGIVVYPRLIAATHRGAHSNAVMPTGSSEFDALLGGGLDAGTSTVVMGPSGTGKSTIVAQFVATAAARGERALVFCFDESPANLLARTSGLGIPLGEHVKAGTVHLLPIDPAEFTAGELSHFARMHVEEGARIVVIDSIDGYITALPEERLLSAHLHELLAFLSEKGIVTVLTLGESGFVGAPEPPVHIAYFADTLILLRYFEVAGEVKLAISVPKKRTGAHERSIRELQFGPDGIRVGPVLANMRGVLAGTPTQLPDAITGAEGERRE